MPLIWPLCAELPPPMMMCFCVLQASFSGVSGTRGPHDTALVST
jgi:hypothetical protein